jgi:hypothetical protein
VLRILIPIALLFLVLEFVRPARSQPRFRRGLLADVFYVPLHYVIRVAVNVTIASALAEAGRELLPRGATHLLSGRPLWLQARPDLRARSLSTGCTG